MASNASPRQVKDEVPSNPHEAFKLACYSYGVKKLADRLTMKPGVLYNKCDADPESHHQPTLRDVLAVTRETGDMRVIDSLNRHFGRAAYDVGEPAACNDVALLDLLLRVGSDHGDLCTAVRNALEDHRFSREEIVRVRSEAFDLISQVLAFVHRLEGLVDE